MIPIICIAMPRVDPTPAIVALAKRKHKRVSLYTMGHGIRDINDIQASSLDVHGVGGVGTGQEHALRRLLFKEAEAGCWVVLQNTQTSPHLLRCVEAFLVEAAAADQADIVAHAFRIWITTEDTHVFPPHLAIISVKVASEPAVGLKASMQALYDDAVDQVCLCPTSECACAARALHAVLCVHNRQLPFLLSRLCIGGATCARQSACLLHHFCVDMPNTNRNRHQDCTPPRMYD